MPRLRKWTGMPRQRVAVTVTFEEYEYVRNNRLEFSAMLSSAIRDRMKEDGEAKEVRRAVHDAFIKAKVEKGNTAEEAEVLWEASESAKRRAAEDLRARESFGVPEHAA